MESISKDDAQEFLDELTALSIKHGIQIDGCGCCGSPFLTKLSYAMPCRYSVSNDGEYLALYPEKGHSGNLCNEKT